MAKIFSLFGEIFIENKKANDAIKETTNIAENKGTGGLGKLASAAGAVTAALGAAAIAAGAFAVKVGAAYEKELSGIAAVTGASADEMESLNKAALEAGAKTAFSAGESASAISELAKAGLTTAQILNGGLAGALDLAAAGEIGVADAAEIASNVLNSFRDDNLSVADAANILAGAANASATDVMGLKMGLSQASAVAAGMGMTFEDTSTALAVFAQNGLKGSDAGTSLKTMLMNLQPVSDKQAALFEKLGLTTDFANNKFYDANGSMRPLNEIAGTLQKSMAGLTDAERAMALETMFGSDAVRAGNILFKEGAAGVNKMNDAMTGIKAADVAAKKLDNFKGSADALMGSLETIGIQLFQELQEPLKKATDVLTDAINKLGANGTLEILGAAIGQIAILLADMLVAVLPVLLDFIGQIMPTLVEIVQMIMPILMQILQAILPIIVALLPMILEVVKTLLPPLVQLLNLLLPPLTMLLNTLIPPLTKVITFLAQAFSVTLSAAINAVMPIVNNLIVHLTNIINFIVNVFTGNWAGAWENIKNILSNAMDAFKNIVKAPINYIIDMINNLFSRIGSIDIPDWVPIIGGQNFRLPKIPRLAVGLDYVPYDDFPALLHKGERVMTAAENKAGSGGGLVVNIGTFVNNRKQDVQEFAEELEYFRSRKAAANGMA